jgi:hypothetical protein
VQLAWEHQQTLLLPGDGVGCAFVAHEYVALPLVVVSTLLLAAVLAVAAVLPQLELNAGITIMRVPVNSSAAVGDAYATGISHDAMPTVQPKDCDRAGPADMT